MLFFGLSFATGIVAVVVAQKLDIECANAPMPKRWTRRNADKRAGAVSYPTAVLLRQQ